MCLNMDARHSKLTEMFPILFVIINISLVNARDNQDWHFKGPNVAFGKPTSQNPDDSSSRYYGDASKAVDGTTDHENGHLTHCSHTTYAQPSDDVWWRVDLGSLYFVSGIKIFNRDNSNRDRLKRFLVSGKTQFNSDIVYRDTSQFSQDVINIRLNAQKQYRYIQIELPKNNTDRYLTLCEVQVFALGCPALSTNNIMGTVQPLQTSMEFKSYSNDFTFYNGVGAEFRITCRQGYDPSKPFIITCQPNREYSTVKPFCRRNTCYWHVPTSPTHGSYLRMNDSTVKLICRIGFEIQNGNGIRRCQQGGSWSGSNPVCVPVKCAVPTIDNGYLSSRYYGNVTRGSFLNYLDELYIKCYKGFDAMATYIWCQATGLWSRKSIEYCQIRSCSSPGTINDGYYKYNGSPVLFLSQYKYNTVLTVQCNEGHQASASQIRCNADRSWDTQPLCLKSNCTIPPFPNGYYTNSTKSQVDIVKFLDLVYPVCINDSFRIIKNDTRECLANGSLSGAVPRCAPLCKILRAPKHGIYVDSKGMHIQSAQHGQRLYIKCNDGFESQPNKSAVFCQEDFNWSGNFPICTAKLCTVEKSLLENNFLIVADGKDRTTFNQTLKLQCKIGYEEDINGSSEIRCNSDTKFVNVGNLLQCTEKICKIDEQKLRQNFLEIADERNKTTYNQTLTLKCIQGYKKVSGNTDLRCNDDKKFIYDDDILQCEENERSTAAFALAGGVGGGCIVVVATLLVVIILVYRRRREKSSRKSQQTMESLKNNAGKSNEVYQGNEYSSIDETEMSPMSALGNVYNTVDPNNDDNSVDYYSFDIEKIPVNAIKVEDLPNVVIRSVSSNEKMKEQFSSFKKGMTAGHTAALKTENRAKNKYRDMYPYDQNRVVLQSGNLKSETDYINASYINGFSEPKHYIAAQAPLSLQKTINDFWRMIWQLDVSKIVMLTRLKEEEKIKCDQYWPEKHSEMYGRVQVTLQQTEYFSEFVVRHFLVSKDNSSKRKLVHFHFTAWPDKGVPKYASSLVHFRQKVINTPKSSKGPIVVHCSAGVGRTGTFIALDIVAEQGARFGYVDVYGCVQSLRKQRVMMVQTQEQYVFLHFALTEALMLSPSVLPATKFIETYRDALRVDPRTKERKLDVEFEMLQKLSPTAEESQYISAKDIQNRKKNRYANILPVEEFMPKFGESANYINAVFLPSYKERNAFIITQSPLETTKQEFWNLVQDHKVHTIVMMNSIHELKHLQPSVASEGGALVSPLFQSDEEIYWPQINSPVKLDNVSVSYIGEEEENGHNVITLEMKHQKKNRTVKLLQFRHFMDDDFPGSPESWLSMIELMQNSQRHAGGNPVVVHCMNGADKSGLYCVISAVLERLKIEQDVAISQTIEIMRNCREQLIISLDQFKFCHDVVLAFINQFETYSNLAEVHA